MAEKLTRRSFLNGLWLVAGGAVAAELGLVGLRFLAPRAAAGAFGGQFDLGTPDAFPAGSVTPVEAGRFYLVHLKDGGFLAVYRRCTHLGCAVPYDPGAGQFVCPCHGSAFDMAGDVLNPPAPRPLDLFAVSLTEDGHLLVDTGRVIERQQVNPEDIFYA